MTPDILERITYRIWPSAPADYSLATVQQRWDAMKAAYQAQRIRELQAKEQKA